MKKMMLIAFLLLCACVPTDLAGMPDAFSLKATSDAAERDAEYYGGLLTATAEAPLIRMTQTAAALVVEQTYWTATAQAAGTQTAIPLTATAQAWTPTPNATTTIVAAQVSAEQTAIANNSIRDDLELQRQASINGFVAWLPIILLVSVVAFAMSGLARHLRYRPIPRDARGDAVPMLDVVDGVVSDLDRNPNGQQGTRREDLKQLPAITAERQDKVTESDQLLDLATRGFPSGKTIADKPKTKAIGERMMRQLPAPTQVQVVPVEMVAGWLGPVLPEIAREAVDAEIVGEEHDNG